jgi:hypothetical protein
VDEIMQRMTMQRAMKQRIHALFAALWLLPIVAGLSCGPGTRTARSTIEPFLRTVQAEDLDRLFCMMAGAADSNDLGQDEASRRAGFRAWARAQYDAYYEGRDLGQVELDEHGITPVKLFSLGKGTYFDLTEARRVAGGAIQVRMDLRFGYASIDLSGFSPGTTFYVCGAPLGRVHAIRKPRASSEETAEVLDRLSLEWTLIRNDAIGECPEGWAVASVVPLEETVATKNVTWAF